MHSAGSQSVNEADNDVERSGQRRGTKRTTMWNGVKQRQEKRAQRAGVAAPLEVARLHINVLLDDVKTPPVHTLDTSANHFASLSPLRVTSSETKLRNKDCW
jgi:hypothetical protein